MSSPSTKDWNNTVNATFKHDNYEEFFNFQTGKNKLHYFHSTNTQKFINTKLIQQIINHLRHQILKKLTIIMKIINFIRQEKENTYIKILNIMEMIINSIWIHLKKQVLYFAELIR